MTALAAQETFGRWFFRLSAVAAVALSALIAVNTLPYFSFRLDFAFLAEKGRLAQLPWWRACFYVHISGGLLCLATGPVLLWAGLLRRAAWMHRWLGWTYVLSVLAWAGPSGLVLSLHAKGGLAGRSCFTLLSLLWFATTALGVRAIRARRFEEHLRWMLRSYSLALSAVFFRVFYAALYAGDIPDETNYPLSLWLSLAASLACGEALIARYSRHPLLKEAKP